MAELAVVAEKARRPQALVSDVPVTGASHKISARGAKGKVGSGLLWSAFPVAHRLGLSVF